MSKLTRRQHYVPQFYLGQWNDGQSKVTCHDLKESKLFTTGTDNVLLEAYYYEDSDAVPDNRVEKMLSNMEGAAATALRNIEAACLGAAKARTDPDATRFALRALTNDDVTRLQDFAAYQYLRVPGAVEQKRFELQTSDVPSALREHALNPGRFTESGYNYIRGRFDRLKIMLCPSPGREFITSDWPCFDLKDSDKSPLLGEELGVSSEVVCYLPLTPTVGAVFVSPAFTDDATWLPPVSVVRHPDMFVRNQNTLVIQQAERFVIASQPETFIFAIAAKRKKARL